MSHPQISLEREDLRFHLPDSIGVNGWFTKLIDDLENLNSRAGIGTLVDTTANGGDLRAAVLAASKNDILVLDSGTHVLSNDDPALPVSVDNLTILGRPGAIIQEESGTATNIFNIGGVGFRAKGFEVRFTTNLATTPNVFRWSGINLAKDVVIEDIEVNTSQAGTSLIANPFDGAENFIVRNCRLDTLTAAGNFDDTILFSGSIDRLLVERCRIQGCATNGAHVRTNNSGDNVSGVVVRHNQFRGAGSGGSGAGEGLALNVGNVSGAGEGNFFIDNYLDNVDGVIVRGESHWIIARNQFFECASTFGDVFVDTMAALTFGHIIALNKFNDPVTRAIYAVNTENDAQGALIFGNQCFDAGILVSGVAGFPTLRPQIIDNLVYDTTAGISIQNVSDAIIRGNVTNGGALLLTSVDDSYIGGNSIKNSLNGIRDVGGDGNLFDINDSRGNTTNYNLSGGTNVINVGERLAGVVVSAGVEDTNIVSVSVQLVDVYGNDIEVQKVVDIWFSDTDLGVPDANDITSVLFTTGDVIKELTTDALFNVQSLVSGTFLGIITVDVEVVIAKTKFVMARVGGSEVVSAELTWT